MQLLRGRQQTPQYYVFKAWGRLGSGEDSRVNGDLVHEHGGNLEAAKKEFRLKFKECAKSEFEFTTPPCQANGGYQVQLLAGQSGQDAAEAARKAGRATAAAAAASSGPACTLTPEVQQFVELIYSEKLMKAHLESQHIDLDKMPLGQITTLQVQQGYAVLTSLADQMKSPSADADEQAARLLALTGQFYNVIPHTFKREKTPPVIDSSQALQSKLEMIESLLNIKRAVDVNAESDGAVHPTDDAYAKLGCALEAASAEEVCGPSPIAPPITRRVAWPRLSRPRSPHTSRWRWSRSTCATPTPRRTRSTS